MMKKAHFRNTDANICIENGLKFDIIKTETKKHRIGAQNWVRTKPYFNLLCCFEWFQQNHYIASYRYLQEFL